MLRQRFWTALLERAKTKLHTNISPGHYSWIGTGAGKYGLGFNYGIRKHDADVELYIDRRKGSEKENKEIFDALAKSKDVIEAAFSETLDWDWVEGRRGCRIKKVVTLGGYRDEDRWPEIHDAMIDAMIRLEKALRPHIAKLKV